MLHKDLIPDGDSLEGSDTKNGDDEYPFFNQPWHAFVKTTIMFVGEIEFADLPIDLNSWLSFLFLLAFVFLIIVVLMNLLNGLAVSDTGLIREQAEIGKANNYFNDVFTQLNVIHVSVSHIARVDTISYTESILLGDPMDFLSNYPPFRWVARLPSLALMRCLFQNKTALYFLHKVKNNS